MKHEDITPVGLEWFRSTATRLRTLRNGSCLNVGLVSCQTGDGTTTVAAGLARFLAGEIFAQTALIDANFRAPRLHEIFGLQRAPGFSDVLDNAAASEVANHSTKRIDDTLSVLPAGSVVESPAGLLGSPAASEVMTRLKQDYDFIVVDCPPLTQYADTTLLGPALDTMLVVLRAEKTRWAVAGNAVEELRATGTHVFGAVLSRKPFFIPGFLYRVL